MYHEYVYVYVFFSKMFLYEKWNYEKWILLVSENPTHTIDFDRYSPSSLATVNNKNSNISISSPRKDACLCLENSTNSNTRYVDNDRISFLVMLLYLVKLCLQFPPGSTWNKLKTFKQ